MEAIKFENDKFMDSTGVVHKKELLSDILDKKNLYSAEEQLIGIWIDGKKLYRKTISFKFDSSTNELHVYHNISNVNEVIRIYGSFKSDDDRRFLPQIYYSMDSQYSITPYVVNNSYIKIFYGNWVKDSANNFKNCYITLEYTKTID